MICKQFVGNITFEQVIVHCSFVFTQLNGFKICDENTLQMSYLVDSYIKVPNIDNRL